MALATPSVDLPRWALIAFGALSVIAGVMALAWPGKTILVLVILLGIHFIVYGIAAIATAFETGQGRVLSVIFGVLALLGGTALWLRPLQNLGALIIVISVFWVTGGIVQTIGAFLDRGEGWGWEVFSGVISLVAGVVAIAWPGMTLLAVAVTVGVWMIVIGLIWLWAGLRRGSAQPAMAT